MPTSVPDRLVRRIPFTPADRAALEPLVGREWLVTNGLGGYASGTVAGVATRRYHGLLVAALPNPLGRQVMLQGLHDTLTLPDGTAVRLSGEERIGGGLDVPGATFLTEFRLEAGLPVWEYRIGDVTVQRRVIMPHRQNTVHVIFNLMSPAVSVGLELRPTVHFRSHDAPVNRDSGEEYRLTISDGEYHVTAASDFPALHLQLAGENSAFTPDPTRLSQVLYRVEGSRGYEFEGALWTPGAFRLTLTPDRPVALVASTEAREVATALTPDEAVAAELERRRRLLGAAPPALREGVSAELVLAADQFIITPAGRLADGTRARAVGDEIRTVIAGYHWFTDWGRDTMISLEGLTLTTGRYREAGAILHAFAHYVQDGLIPNMFPDGSDEGLYHTADATLWFFHAADRYVETTGDRHMVQFLLPTLRSIVEHHRRGTRFGIGMDPSDGLLTQGAEGYQLTWMDAKVDGWVVTPRRGKAVEINALWYNGLCLLEEWLHAECGVSEAAPYAALADRVRRSFNERFWYEVGGYLYDVVDGPGGDSTECRPNQLLAVALPRPVLDPSRWHRVLEVVGEQLLTPVGLRSLARNHPDYKARYFGDLRARDAAYHQGTVWAWLIGPWVDAWLRVHPGDLATARRFLHGLADHLGDFGVGSIAEIFDAEPPFTPRGCIAQAWSIAEELRCWAKTSGRSAPND